MKKHFVGTLLALLLGTGAIWAAHFWEKKTFNEWSEKEVTRMLTKSPWARTVDIPLGRLGASSDYASDRGSGGGRRGGDFGAGSGEFGGRGGGGRGGGGFSRGGGGGFPPTARLTIRWYSALPIKHAIAKIRFGTDAVALPEAKEMLEREETHYIIGISGVPPSMFRSGRGRAHSESERPKSPAERLKLMSERVKSASFLKIKGREPIPAGAVHVQAGPGGNTVDAETLRSGADIYVMFSRGQNGSHAIMLEDKNVEFVTKIGRRNVKRKFKLKDMMYNGKLEL